MTTPSSTSGADAPAATHVAVLHGVSGEGPPLLYVPGIDGSGELLLGTAARLAERFRLVRVRYECTGPAPAGGDRYEALADSVLARAREAGLERALVLAESFGVAVALTLALRAPTFASGLALVNGFARWDRPARLAVSRFVLGHTPPTLFRWARSAFAPLTLFWPRRDPRAVAEFRAADLRALGPGYARRARMIAGVDVEPELGRIAAPVSLFASDSDRIVASVPHARRMHARLPDAELEVLPRAGHVVLPLAEEPWTRRLLDLQERAERVSAG